jgi:hypothetical protein
MTDFRDPNRPDYRDPQLSTDAQPWSSATWGWIAGIAIVVLVLIFAFGTGSDRVADTTSPPGTVGQRTTPPPGPAGPKTDAPTMNRPAPAPSPAPDPGR